MWLSLLYCMLIRCSVRQRRNFRTYTHVKKTDCAADMQERTHKQTFGDASMTQEGKIVRKKSKVNGMKGRSSSFGFPGYDVIMGTSIAYMHTVLLRVAKMFMSCWLTLLFSIHHTIVVINYLRVMQEEPVSNLLITSVGYLKVCVTGNTTKPLNIGLGLFTIYCLSCEVSCINCTSTSQLLEHFCLCAENLYNARIQTFNLHQLLHLKIFVIDNGPLWSCS